MTLSDEELALMALREAQLILAEPGPRDPAKTINELLALLDRNDVVEAVDRLEAGAGRLLEPSAALAFPPKLFSNDYMSEEHAKLKSLVAKRKRQLAKAEASLEAAMIADHPIKVGDVVEDKFRHHYLVHALRVVTGHVQILGRKKTKSGWHRSPCEVSWRGVRKLDAALAQPANSATMAP